MIVHRRLYQRRTVIAVTIPGAKHFLYFYPLAHIAHQLPDPEGRQHGENHSVDECGRLLIIHPDAGSIEQAYQAVFGHFAEFASCFFFKSPGNLIPTVHIGYGTVVQIHRVFTAGFF